MVPTLILAVERSSVSSQPPTGNRVWPAMRRDAIVGAPATLVTSQPGTFDRDRRARVTPTVAIASVAAVASATYIPGIPRTPGTHGRRARAGSGNVNGGGGFFCA